MKRLILFDIDGTLLTTGGAAGRAFHRALLEVYGTAGPIHEHAFAGKTDPQIARELLRAAGLTDAMVDAGFPALWPSYLRELSLELALPGYRTEVLPGVFELLDALSSRAAECVTGLLTGNVEAGAALKLQSAGLGERFHIGAFGSDSERRDELPAIAVRRARRAVGHRFEGSRIVIVGDTPHDISCGASLGVRAVGVATGSHSAELLASVGAHAVLPDLSSTDAVLQALLNGERPADSR